PSRNRATSTKSESRALVHEPRKATSILVPVIGLPPSRPMCASASSTAGRSPSETSWGEGMGSSIATDCPGLSPQVTVGGTSSARMITTSSYSQPVLDPNDSQLWTAASHSAAVGAYRLPSRYATVVASGFTYPKRAPPSTDMLHTVMRSSMLIESKTSPAYSYA